MADHAHVIRIAAYEPKDRQQFLEATERVLERMRGMEGNFGAQVCESPEEPRDVVVISRWESDQALSAFEKMLEEGMREEGQQRTADLLASKPRIYHLRPLS